MLAVGKIRMVSAVLVTMQCMPLARARSADAPLRRALHAASAESKATPRRIPRLLSRREIFQAIQNDFARRATSARGELRPEDLKIQFSVPVLNDDVGLEVKRVGYDAIRRETVFQLWASHEPQYLPFEVTTRRNPRSLGLDQLWVGPSVEADTRGGRTVGQPVSRAASKPPVLAKPGRPATLIMLGQNMRITTTVVPLQPGTKGQRILVRDLTTARVTSAEIVDEGLLQTSF